MESLIDQISNDISKIKEDEEKKKSLRRMIIITDEKYNKIVNCKETKPRGSPTYYCTPFTPLRWNEEKGEYEDPKDPKNLKETRVSL